MPTSREIIDRAFEELGLGPAAHSVQTEDYDTGLRRLQDLLAEWSGSGASGGYAMEAGLDEETGTPIDGVRGVACALAADLAPGYGKEVSRRTLANARRGEALMRAKSSSPPTLAVDYTTMPAGQGWRVRQMNLNPDDGEITPDEVDQ